ncbi:MAG: flagellar hook-basal body complex protein FliE [Candidatus Bathyarchaeota archaeon]|nr:MAG: flagellar hook-basal body complex protein FliE [Candidatus Bathyarchaeota archaeon]
MKNTVVIGVTGMPGAGKATVIEIAQKMDYGVVIMGDEVREETQCQGLEQTPANVGRIMLKMRQEGGPASIAKRCIPKIEKMKNIVIIIDGIRSIYEADEFKKHFRNFKLLAIHSSPGTRFKRLFKRRRSDDPAGWETFLERDWRELRVGIGSAIASADMMIVNEGRKATLKAEVKKTLENVIEDAESRSSSKG